MCGVKPFQRFVFIEKERPIKNLMYQAGLIRDDGSRPIRFYYFMFTNNKEGLKKIECEMQI
jgi:hypothetical protein